MHLLRDIAPSYSNQAIALLLHQMRRRRAACRQTSPFTPPLAAILATIVNTAINSSL